MEYFAGSGADHITGAGGADRIFGAAGADILSGGGGDDVLYGGTGADRIDGGAGIDTASYADAAAGVVVGLAAGGTAGAAQGDTLVSIEVLEGSDFADMLAGGTGAETLYGGGGDDILRGSAGADVLNGGNRLVESIVAAPAVPADGIDTVSYFTGTVGVSVSLVTGKSHGGDAEGDTLVGIETLSGSQGNDSLVGDTGANTLQGWNGNDVLVGAGGTDTLTGGAGADRFVYGSIAQSPVGAGADRITDFSHAQGDRIDLSAIDANISATGDQAFRFIGTGLYSHHAGELRFAETAPGVVTIAGDVNGDGVSDFHITLSGHLTLVAADFVL